MSRSFSAYGRHIGISVGFLILYFGSSLIFRLFPQFDVIAVTMACDVFISIVGAIYMRFFFRPGRKGYRPGLALLMLSAMVPIWYCVQIAATFILQTVPDTGADVYDSAVSINASLYLLLTVLVAPVTEEILMRGILFRHLKCVFPLPAACFVSALVFAVLHGTLVHIYLGTVFGVVFALIYEYTGKLRYPIAAHMFSNLMSALGGYFALPDILFHPFVFVPMNLVCLIGITLWCIWLCNEQKHRQERDSIQLPETPVLYDPVNADVRPVKQIVSGESADLNIK